MFLVKLQIGGLLMHSFSKIFHTSRSTLGIRRLVEANTKI